MIYVRMGPYDDKIMPAAVLYGGAGKKHQCAGAASKFMFDIKDGKGAGEYNREDIEKERTLANAVDSVMLRPGYAIQLFE